jgi:single-strand DNA-binding protein
MAGSVNRVTLLGHVGKDPIVKAIPSGAKVANFSIATTDSYTDKNTNQKVEKTEWHNLVAWRGLAEVIEKYVHKGDKLYIEGKLTTRSWDDQNGQKRYMTEILIDQMVMLGSKGGQGGGERPAAAATSGQPQRSGPGVSAEDDLPF